MVGGQYLARGCLLADVEVGGDGGQHLGGGGGRLPGMEGLDVGVETFLIYILILYTRFPSHAGHPSSPMYSKRLLNGDFWLKNIFLLQYKEDRIEIIIYLLS